MLFDHDYILKEDIEYRESKVNKLSEDGKIVKDVDFSSRRSLESILRITIDLPFHIKEWIKDSLPGCHIPRQWTLLKYKKGDFFIEHIDKNLGDRLTIYGKQFHIATILLFPPKSFSRYEGGELIVKYDSDEMTFIADETRWTCVFFKLKTWHRVEPITDGTRYVFKASIFENYL